jgi:hypothetical protein
MMLMLMVVMLLALRGARFGRGERRPRGEETGRYDQGRERRELGARC